MSEARCDKDKKEWLVYYIVFLCCENARYDCKFCNKHEKRRKTALSITFGDEPSAYFLLNAECALDKTWAGISAKKNAFYCSGRPKGPSINTVTQMFHIFVPTHPCHCPIMQPISSTIVTFLTTPLPSSQCDIIYGWPQRKIWHRAGETQMPISIDAESKMHSLYLLSKLLARACFTVKYVEAR